MKLTFLGDIFPAEEAFSVGFGIKSQFERHKGLPWKESICSITQSSDIVVGNLESPLLSDEFACKNDFYGVPEFASFLKDCGISHLNIANNHILEHGIVGYNQTVKILNDAGMGVIGNRNDILFLRKNNCTIAIVGFCGVDLNTDYIQNTFAVLNKYNLENTLRQMDEAKVDLKIFCFHWGNEYIHKPSLEQRKLATSLIDAGANIIIGHHPHVIQPYERYKQGVIFYSLGNFCFDNPHQSHQFSIGMGVNITFDTIKKEIEQVNTFGVELSLKGLMHKMPLSHFNSYYNKMQKEFEEIKDSYKYNKLYEKELKRRHFAERILMKVSLLRLCLNINMNERRMLLSNLIQYYLR